MQPSNPLTGAQMRPIVQEAGTGTMAISRWKMHDGWMLYSSTLWRSRSRAASANSGCASHGWLQGPVCSAESHTAIGGTPRYPHPQAWSLEAFSPEVFAERGLLQKPMLTRIQVREASKIIWQVNLAVPKKLPANRPEALICRYVAWPT
jgi:hypothetical protein